MPDYKNRDEYIKQAKQRMVKGATAKFKMPKSFPSKPETGGIAPTYVGGLAPAKGRSVQLSDSISLQTAKERPSAQRWYGLPQPVKVTPKGTPSKTHKFTFPIVHQPGGMRPARATMKQQIKRRKYTKRPPTSRD